MKNKILLLHVQERNEVRRRPGQEASLAAPFSNLKSFGRKFTVLKKVLVKLLGLFGAPIMIRRPGNCAPLPPSLRPCPHDIYVCSEVIWSAAWVKLVSELRLAFTVLVYCCQTKAGVRIYRQLLETQIYFTRSKRWNPATVRVMLRSPCSRISCRN